MNILRPSIRRLHFFVSSAAPPRIVLTNRPLQRPNLLLSARRYVTDNIWGRSSSARLVEQPSAQVKKLAENLSSSQSDASTERKRGAMGAVEEAKLVFEQVWRDIESECGGRDECSLPKEMIFLMGAPGSGKGSSSPAICRARGITNNPIVVSHLLQDPEVRSRIDRGEMVNDALVLKLLLKALMHADPVSGVLIDGFPRTEIQVECLKLLRDKMQFLRSQYASTDLKDRFPRPVFRLTVLYVDEEESVRRQLKRGRMVKEHNELVRTTGQGEYLMERATDSDESLIRARYKVFQQHFDSIMRLNKIFPFHLINAIGSIDEVIRKIWQEFEYQSSLELDQETYDSIQHIPIADKVGQQARQELILRLEQYQQNCSSKLEKAVHLIESSFIAAIKRHSISGLAQIRVPNSHFEDQMDVDIVMDILSERGYEISSEKRVVLIPKRIDKETFEIVNEERILWIFRIKFPKHNIRGVFGGGGGGVADEKVDVASTEQKIIQ